MTKKHFRQHWEQYFLHFNDAELYAISALVHNMKSKNQWHGFVGKVWDAYTAQNDKETDQSIKSRNLHDSELIFAYYTIVSHVASCRPVIEHPPQPGGPPSPPGPPSTTRSATRRARGG